MTTLFSDLKYACRMLRKRPGFTAIALITLAIGIGANMLMFSVVNAFLFRPLPIKDPDQLVHFGIRTSERYPGSFDYEMYSSIRDDNPVFSDLIALSRFGHNGTWVQGSTTKEMSISYVSGNFFSALGVKPLYGQAFQPEEERHGSDPVAVLSHRIWQELGGEPNMVGRIVQINNQPCRIAAVAPKEFSGMSLFGPDIWMPLGAYDQIDPRKKEEWGWHYPPSLQIVGRLKGDLDMVAAEARVQGLVPRLKAINHRWAEDPKVRVYLAQLDRVLGGEKDPDTDQGLGIWTAIFMGTSSIILLIACLNLANMLNVQGAQRQREIAIRMAIGGGRLRIVRQLLIESLLVALMGAVLGIVPMQVGIRMFNAWTTSTNEPILIPTSFDIRVLGVTLGVCLLATLLAGLKPALKLSNRDVMGDLKDAGVGMLRTTRRKWRLIPRGLSVTVQIALSVVFVMVGLLFVRTALKVAYSCPGFDLKDKIVVKIDSLASGYTTAQARAACDRLGEHLRDMAGIQAVGWSRGFPVDDTDAGLSQKIMEYQPGIDNENTQSLIRKGPMVFSVDEGYFEAMDISLLQGRAFRSLDSQSETAPPVILDQNLAHRLRRDNNVLDCLIQHGWESELQVCRVVGVVPNQQDPSGETSQWSYLYQPIPADQVPVYLHVRTSSGAMSPLLQSLSATIRQIDPQLKVVSLMTLAEHHRNGRAAMGSKMAAQTIAIFGILAMFMAGLGLYAVKGHLVATRTNEIGLRMALGAQRWDVLALVFRQNLASTLVGLGLGILLATGLACLIRSGLHGISPMDPVSIVATITVLGLTSLLAGFFPARRAVKIDPMEALRYE